MVFHGFFNVYRTIAPTKRGANPIHVTTIRAGGSGIAMSRAAARGRAAQSYPEINVAISRLFTGVPPLYNTFVERGTTLLSAGRRLATNPFSEFSY